MQTNRKAVRFYIDRDADTPVVRSVPVSHPSVAAVSASRAPITHRPENGDESAMAFAAAESRRRGARHLLTALRKPRRNAS
ncbi:MAG TPA: hypothetical protein VGR22_07745 [Thermomicrobiales bacterium]|nr:hypothetical protein [Thermomicrobiales bacterium]